jgi:hypothetical protein
MKLRDLIDELIQLEAAHQASNDEHVYVELEIPSSNTWHGCLIAGTGRDDEGNLVIRAVTP